MVPVTVSVISEVLSHYVKPGYKIGLMEDFMSDSLYIRIDNLHNMSNQILSIPRYNMLSYGKHFKVIDHIVDYIACNTSALVLRPKYERIFNDLMEQILWNEFTPGKVWE